MAFSTHRYVAHLIERDLLTSAPAKNYGIGNKLRVALLEVMKVHQDNALKHLKELTALEAVDQVEQMEKAFRFQLESLREQMKQQTQEGQ